jgi:hypothetical protein
MFKFEMAIGWLGNGTVKIETNDFDIIETLKDFIEFQESEGWVGAYEFSAIDEEFEDEEEEAEEELEETMSGQAAQ